MVAEIVRQLPRRAARHRHLPSGQSRISVADGVEQKGQGQNRRQAGCDRRRLSRHPGRNRFAHHDGQWSRRARLGRRRHRGGGGDAGPALFDAAAGGDRREAHRQAEGGHDRDRPRAHRHPDAAQARRGRQIRGIFRPWTRESLDRRSCHHRQHVARIWCDLRLLPRRRRYAEVSCGYRPAHRASRLGRRLQQGAGHVPHQVDAGPRLHRRAQARIVAGRAFARHPALATSLDKNFSKAGSSKRVPVQGRQHDLGHGDVVIAAITSCTNTSNPNVMVGAGLLARKAVAKGLTVKPWVKTSLAPGSQVVADYLDKSGLQKDLDKLGYNLVGFGCTTCIGNSGPLAPEISKTINDKDLVAAAVLSGNRNFEGRVNADVRANYLASPPLVVAYALAGSMYSDLVKQPLGLDKKGKKVFLRDIWPSSREISGVVRKTLSKQMFTKKYADVFKGDSNWRSITVKGGLTYSWDKKSTYVQNPPYFVGMGRHPAPLTDIVDARVLCLLLDSITTDHISPAGSIKVDSPAGKYLIDHKVKPADFNQYGTRGGNHEVMMRGTFANIRLKNQMVPGVEGGVTVHYPSRQRMSIYDAAMRYKSDRIPLVVFAGKEYGSGSSRDWAAKGPNLLGVRAVITQSFERIHRSNLIGMGVLPLCFEEGTSWQSLGLRGDEQVTIRGLHGEIKPRQRMIAEIVAADGGLKRVPLVCRIDTLDELDYFKHGGILHYVLRHLVAA